MPARLLVIVSGVLFLTTASLPALGQPAPTRPDRRAAVESTEPAAATAPDDDAAPQSESGAPDPLTPQSVDGPAPRAPGAPVAHEKHEAPKTVDPLVVALRERLAAINDPRNSGEREDLAALRAYYAAEDVQPVWVGADDWGLEAAAFDLPEAFTGTPTLEQRADTEIKIATAVLKYARYARGGRLDPSAVSRKFDQKPVIFEPGSVLEAIAVATQADGYLRGLHPKHQQFEQLRQKLLEARADSSSQRQASLIKRLIVNMERWRWMPPELGRFYVWDAIPEQMTRVVDDGKTVLSEKIVVGKVGTPTPVFSADMQFVIFHPSWGVPPGMKAAELAPRLRNTGGGWLFSFKPSASAVLRAHGLTVSRGGRQIDPDSVDWSTANIQSYSFIQAPGASNVLGIVKFRFPNKHDVYMHDTTERNLFSGRVRAFSHGCMRVQNPINLAEVLLAHDKGWSKAEVNRSLNRGEEVKLTTPIPVHVTYFTLKVDESGKLHEYGDLYGLDNRVASALARREVRLLQTSSAEPAAEDDDPIAERPQRSSRRSTRRARRSQQQSAGRSPNPLNTFNPFGF